MLMQPLRKHLPRCAKSDEFSWFYKFIFRVKILLFIIILLQFDSPYAQQSVAAIDSLINNTKQKHLFSIKEKSSSKAGAKDKVHRMDTTYYFDKGSKLPVAVMIDNVVWDSASTTVFRFYEAELIRYHHDYTIRRGEKGYQNYYFQKGVFIEQRVRNPKSLSPENVLNEANQLYRKALDKLSQSPEGSHNIGFKKVGLNNYLSTTK